MDPIIIKAAYGNTDKTVKISRPDGAGGILHLYIDNYFYGQFVYYEGSWQLRPQSPLYFTSDEMRILEDIVNERFPGGRAF